MKKLVRLFGSISLIALCASPAYAFPGGWPGNVPYPGLCTMGNPDNTGEYFVRIPCWAGAIRNHPYF